MKNLIKVVCFLLFCIPEISVAQQKFTAIPISNRSVTSLATHFSDYALFSINTAEIRRYSKSKSGSIIDFELQLPGYTNWKFNIYENDILAKDYFLSISSPWNQHVHQQKLYLPHSIQLYSVRWAP